jgi:hypothetical protein
MSIKNRLALYKKRASESQYIRTWKEARYPRRAGYYKEYNAISYGEKGQIFTDNFDIVGEKIADSHELIRLRHTGYYSDSFQHGVIRGAIVKLKTARGVYYIPATYFTEFDGVTLHMQSAELVETKGNKRRARLDDCHEGASVRMAYLADSYAEHEAEKAREDDAKFQAEQKIESLKEDKQRAREAARDLIKDIRAQRERGEIAGGICSLLTRELIQLRQDIKNANAFIKDLKGNYWLSVDY